MQQVYLSLLCFLTRELAALRLSTGTQNRSEPIHLWNPIYALPQELKHVGRRLFNSMNLSNSAFDEFVRGTAEPRTLHLGHGRSIALVRQKTEETYNPWKDVQVDTEHDEYGILANNMSNSIMIDIGSNIGTQAIIAAKFNDEMRVVAMEPAPTSYFYLLWNMHLNGVTALSKSDLLTSPHGRSGIIALNSAVTRDGHSSKMKYHWGRDSEQFRSSLLQSGGDNVSANVQSVTLPSLLEDYGIRSVSLLKIDCEGCEHGVFTGMDKFICDRRRFQRIEGELHFAVKQAYMETVQRLDMCHCSRNKFQDQDRDTLYEVTFNEAHDQGRTVMFSCS